MTVRRILTQVLLLGGAMLLGALLSATLEMRSSGERSDALRVEALERELMELRAERAPPLEKPTLSRRGGRRPTIAAEATHRRPLADPGRPTTVVPEPVASTAGGRGVSPALDPAPAADVPVLDVIRALTAADARQADIRLVGPSLAARFKAAAEGPTVRGDEIEPDDDLAAGTVIVLDEGAHDFSAFADAHRGQFPADLTFRGIGKDRTLLRLHEVSATGEMRNLAFEDLTLDTGGHYLADVRGDEPISIRFERSRVIGFDAVPGGGVLLAARHGAVLARDTTFEAGFGSAPGTGSFFHVRGPFLVRFERCVVRGAFKSLYEKSPKAAYLYADCRFEGMHPDRRRDLETPDENVRLQNCAVDYAARSDPPLRRAVSELNSDWD